MRISILLFRISALILLASGATRAQTSAFYWDRLYIEFEQPPSLPLQTVTMGSGNRAIDLLFETASIDSISPIFFLPGRTDEQSVFYTLGMDKPWTVFFSGKDQLDSIYESLADDPDIAVVDTVYFGTELLTPLDTDYPLQWYHDQGNDIDLDSPLGWDFDTIAFDGSLAIVDKGIDSNHVEFKTNLWKNQVELANAYYDWGQYEWVGDGLDNDLNGVIDDFSGWDFGDNGNNPQPDYYQLQWPACDEDRLLLFAHGQIVGGPAIARTCDGMGWGYCFDANSIAGVIWKAKAINIKLSRPFDGSTDARYASEAIEYAATTGARVINLSYAFDKPYALQYAVNFAEAVGALVVCGLPNETQFGRYPWVYSNVLVVSKIDQNGYSMHHPSAGSGYVLAANGVVAPGVNIFTTYRQLTTSWNCPNPDEVIGSDYDYFSGTSLAIPQVASIATMVTSARKKRLGTYLSPTELKQVIIATANSQIQAQDPPGFDPYWGNGLVNFAKAMAAVCRGDANNDGIVNISDAQYLVNYMFGGGPLPVPVPETGDSDGSCALSISDAVYLINYIHAGGPPPPICTCYWTM